MRAQPPHPGAERGPTRREIWLAGFLGSCVALAVLFVWSSISTSVAFPPTALAEFIIRTTPGDVATALIEAFGYWARRLLTLFALVGAAAFGGALPTRLQRHERPDVELSSIIAGAFSLAAMYLGPADVDAVPAVVACALAAVVNGYTLRAFLASFDATHVDADPGRRRALAWGIGGAAGIALAGGGLGYLLRRLAGPDTNVAIAEAAKRATIPERGPFPEIAGLTPEITSAEDHYVVDINLVRPSVEAEGWSLDVKGMVATPLTLTFTDLQSRFVVVEEYSTLTCVSNEVGGDLVGHSAWRGVRLADVLKTAGVEEGAVDVVFRGADGYSDSIPFEIAQDPRVLLAFAQNGEPLTQDHGFPCRVRVPPIYGMKNVKWLEEVEVVPGDYEGYWADRGWSDEAVVRTQSRIDVAGEDFSAVVGDPTWIAGIAWAGVRGISKVEVSTDGGATWQEALLKEPISSISWRQWAFEWLPEEAGAHIVMCRATDGDGRTQTSEEEPPHPAGATGWHTVDVDVT
jgi:DMSO/TMAO reductase YedYZ molybdopterin-dependent catalytic subunit